MALKKSQRSLKAWTKQKWRTKSGKPSTQGSKATGERYLPQLQPVLKEKQLKLVSKCPSSLKKYRLKQKATEK